MAEHQNKYTINFKKISIIIQPKILTHAIIKVMYKYFTSKTVSIPFLEWKTQTRHLKAVRKSGHLRTDVKEDFYAQATRHKIPSLDFKAGWMKPEKSPRAPESNFRNEIWLS